MNSVDSLDELPIMKHHTTDVHRETLDDYVDLDEAIDDA